MLTHIKLQFHRKFSTERVSSMTNEISPVLVTCIIKKIIPTFVDGVQLSQGYRVIMRRQFTFILKMPRVSGPQLTSLRRMKG